MSAEHSIPAELWLYDQLFTIADFNDMEEGKDYTDYLNPDSLVVNRVCRLEPSLRDAKAGERYQFMPRDILRGSDSGPDGLVFNRIVTLKDSWANSRLLKAKNIFM